MKKSNLNEDARYISPSIILSAVSVEKGFASSGDEGIDSPRMIISDYGDGVTF